MLLGIVFILRIPSFFEPYSYGDEMIYLTLGQGIRQGVPLYSGLHDNKPPLLYLTAAVAGNLFWFKTILAFWHMITILIFWKTASALFPKNRKLPVVSSVIFALFTTIPLLEGHIANAEIFMIGPTIAAFYVLFTKKSIVSVFFAGVLFSIAAMFKIPAAFEVPAVIIFWMATVKNVDKKNILELAKKIAVMLAGFLIPIALTFIWYFIHGALYEYFIAAYAQNFGYVSSWRPSDVQKPFLEKNAPLLIRAAVVGILGLFLLLRRKQFSKQFLLINLWLVFSLFAVALSERPYPHYLIQAIPAVSLLVGMLTTLINYEQVYVIFPLALAAFVPYYFRFWHYPTLPYYQRFLEFSLGKTDKQSYLKSFGGQIPTVYNISEYIQNSTASNSNIYVWGDTSTVYALTKRLPPIKYVADYHIRDFSSIEFVIEKLKSSRVPIIVVLKDSNPPPELDSFISKNYILAYQYDNSKVWKLINNKLRDVLNKPPNR